VPGRAAAAPGSATPELDSTHMNGLIDDKKRSVVPTVQSKVFVLSSFIDEKDQKCSCWTTLCNALLSVM